MVAQNMNKKILSKMIRASWSGDDAFTPGTPQRRALEWMAIEDTSFDASSPPKKMIQRYALVTVFFTMGGFNRTDSQATDVWTDINGPECDWNPNVLNCDGDKVRALVLGE